MKKLIIALTVLFGISVASAETWYVSSQKTNAYDKKNGTKVINVLPKNTVVTASCLDGWCYASQGWVKKLFLSGSPTSEKVSLLGGANENARVHARTRASSDVTAASSRGGFEHNWSSVRARNVDEFLIEEELTIMESIKISNSDLEIFIKTMR